MKLFHLLSLFLLITASALSQTSIVQDTKGETALTLGSAGVVAINAKDESISFSYGILLNKETARARKDFDYMGISVKGKGKNGLINIIKNDEFQYDGSIGIFYFKDSVLDNNRNIQFYASSDFLFSQFKLYDSSSSIPFSNQVFGKNSQGFKITAGINLEGKLFGPIPYLLGIAVNGGQRNNSNDIKAIEVANFFTQIDPLTSQVRSIQKDKNSAYSIKDFKNNLRFTNFNIDFGPQFFCQYLLLFHSRWSVQEFRKPQFNPAMGLYFTKTGEPLRVVAGIQVQTLDWANTSQSIKTRSERTTLNIVAGFSF
jgi:hypothetical protein